MATAKTKYKLKQHECSSGISMKTQWKREKDKNHGKILIIPSQVELEWLTECTTEGIISNRCIQVYTWRIFTHKTFKMNLRTLSTQATNEDSA